MEDNFTTQNEYQDLEAATNKAQNAAYRPFDYNNLVNTSIQTTQPERSNNVFQSDEQFNNFLEQERSNKTFSMSQDTQPVTPHAALLDVPSPHAGFELSQDEKNAIASGNGFLDFASTLYQGRGTAADLMKQAAIFNIPVEMPSKEKFAKTNNLSMDRSDAIYNSLMQDYLKFKDNKFDPYDTKEHYYPDTKEYRDLGLLTNKALMAYDLPHSGVIMNGGEFKETINTDENADAKRVYLDKNKIPRPLAMAHDNGVNNLYKVQDVDGMGWHWQEAESNMQEIPSDIIRSTWGARQKYSTTWTNPITKAFEGGMSAVDSSLGFLSDVVDISYGVGHWATGNGYRRLSDTLKANELERYLKEHPNATSLDRDNFMASIKNSSLGSGFYNDARAIKHFNDDEQGYGTLRGTVASFSDFVGMMLPSVAIGWGAGLGASLATELGADAVAAANVSSKIATAINTISGPSMFAGMTTSQLREWGSDADSSNLVGGAIGVSDYLLQGMTHKILQNVDINSMNKYLGKLYSEEGLRIASDYGKKTIEELPQEAKAQAVRNVFQKLSKFKDKIGESIKNTDATKFGGNVKESLIAGGESMLHMTALFNVQNGLAGIMNSMLDTQSRETIRRYDNVSWNIDPNDITKAYRTESDGTIVPIGPQQMMAEQRDLNMAEDIKNGKNPLQTNVLAEASMLSLSTMVANFIKHIPVNVSNLGKSQAQQSNIDRIAQMIATSTSPDKMIASLKKNIDGIQFDKDFISQDGQVITTPRPVENQAKYDEAKKIVDDEYNTAKTELTNKYTSDKLPEDTTYEDELKKLEDDKNKKNADIDAQMQKEAPKLSKDEALKKALYDRILYRTQQIKRYGLDKPGQTKINNNSSTILSETLDLYDKLEKINTIKKEKENTAEDSPKSSFDNFAFGTDNKALSLDHNTDDATIAKWEQQINEAIAFRGTAEEGRRFSGRYNELYNTAKKNEFIANTDIAIKRLEAKNITRENTNEDKYQKYLNRELNELFTKGATKKEQFFFEINGERKRYDDISHGYDDIDKIMFDRKQGVITNVIKEHNDNIDANAIKEPDIHIKGVKNTFSKLHSHLDNLLRSSALDLTERGQINGTEELSATHLQAKVQIGNIFKTFEYNTKEVNDNLSNEISSLQKDYQEKLQKTNDHLLNIQKEQSLADGESLISSSDNMDQPGGALHDMNSINEEKFITTEDIKQNTPEGTKIDVKDLDKLNPQMQEYLRQKMFDRFTKGYILDNARTIDSYLKWLTDNVSTLGNIEYHRNNLEDFKLYIDTLQRYGLVNRELFQKQMDNKDEKDISPLFNKTFERLSDANNKSVKDFSKKYFGEIDKVIDLIKETDPARETRQVKEKANALEIKHDILKSVKDTLAKFEVNAVIVDKLTAKLNEIAKLINDNKIDTTLPGGDSVLDLSKIIKKYQSESDPKEKEKILDTLYDIELKFVDADEIIADIPLEKVQSIMQSIKTESGVNLSESQFMFVNPLNVDKLDLKNSKHSRDYLAHAGIEDVKKYKGYLMIQYLNTFKNTGNKGIRDIYAALENVYKSRQSNGDNNKVFTYTQKQVLIQALMNWSRGAVESKDNIFLNEAFKDYYMKWSFLVDGYAGAGKTSVFVSDFIEVLNEIKRQEHKEGDFKPIQYGVVSANESLIDEYRSGLKVSEQVREGNQDASSFFNLKDILDGNLKGIYSNDVIILDEFSLLDDAMYKKFKENTKEFKGQIIFVGDSGQSHVETQSIDDKVNNVKVYNPQQIREDAWIQHNTAAFRAGECSSLNLTESFRSGDIQLQSFVDYLRNMKKHGIGSENSLTSLRYGRIDGKLKGIRLVDPGSFESVITSNNPEDPGFIEMYNEFKNNGESLSENNIMLIVMDHSMKQMIVDKYGKSNPGIENNIYLAYNDGVHTDKLCSGLKSSNVFVALDFNYLSSLDHVSEPVESGYHDIPAKSIFMSGLMMTPITRVYSDDISSGYLKVYVPFESKHLSSKELDYKNNETISKYRVEDVSDLKSKRQREIQFLEKVKENKSTEEKPEDGTKEKESKDDTITFSYRELKLADESASKIMSDSKKGGKIKKTSDASINSDEVHIGPQKEKLSKDKKENETFNKRRYLDDSNVEQLFINEKIDAETNRGNQKEVTKLQKLSNDNKVTIEDKLKKYNDTLSNPNDYFENINTRINTSESNLKAIARSETSVLMVKDYVEVKDGNKLYYHIPMVNVVGTDGNKPILDFYFLNNRYDKNSKTDQSVKDAMIQKAYLYAEKNGAHVNMIHNIEYGHDKSILGDNKNSSLDVFKDEKLENHSQLAEGLVKKYITDFNLKPLTEKMFWNKEDSNSKTVVYRNVPFESGEYLTPYMHPDNPNQKIYLVGKRMHYENKDFEGTVMSYDFALSPKGDSVITKRADELNQLKPFEKRHQLFKQSGEMYANGQKHHVSTSYNLFKPKGNIAIDALASKMNSEGGLFTKVGDKRNAYHEIHELIHSHLEVGDTIFSKYLDTVDTYDNKKLSHVIMNYFGKDIIERIASDPEKFETLKESLETLGATKENLKTVDSMYSFMDNNYLNFLSTDFKPEVDYKDKESAKDNKLLDSVIRDIVNEKDPIKKATKIEDAKAEIHFSSSPDDPFKQQNIDLNIDRLNKIISLHENKENSPYFKATVKDRKTGSFNNDYSKKDKPLQELIDEYKNSHNELNLLPEETNKNKDPNYKQWGIDLIYQDKNNGIKIPLRVQAKKLTSEYIEKAIKSLDEVSKKISEENKNKKLSYKERKELLTKLAISLNTEEAMRILKFNYGNFDSAPDLRAILDLRRDKDGKLDMNKSDDFDVDKKIKIIKNALKIMSDVIDAKGDYAEYANKVNFWVNPFDNDGALNVDKCVTSAQRINDYQVVYEHEEVKFADRPKTESRAEKMARRFGFDADVDIKTNVDKTGTEKEFDYSDQKETLKQALSDILGSNTVNGTRESKSPLRTSLEEPIRHIDDINQDLLGNLHSSINAITGEKSIKLSLFKNANGEYSVQVGRHEAMHYISLFLLTPKQKASLENEVKQKLEAEGLPSTRTDIYEHIADEYMYKEQIKNQTWLEKFVSKVKNFINKYIAITLTQADLYYGADKGYFKDADVRDFEETNLNKSKVINEYNDEEANNKLKEYLSIPKIESLTQLQLPAHFRDYSPYNPSLEDVGSDISMVSILKDIKDTFKKVYSSYGDIEATIRSTDETGKTIEKKMKISEMTLEQASLIIDPKERYQYNNYQLSKPEIINTLLQKTFYNGDISRELKAADSIEQEQGKDVVQSVEMSSYGDDKFNPDNLHNGKLKLWLKTIPMYREANRDNFVEVSGGFIPERRIKDVMNTLFSELKVDTNNITYEDIINGLNRMKSSTAMSDERNVIHSLLNELRNVHTTLKQIEHIKSTDTDKYEQHKKYYDDKLQAMYNVMSRVKIAFESITDSNIGFWNNKKFETFTNGANGISYKNLKSSIQFNMFNDDMHINDSMKQMLSVEDLGKAIYRIKKGEISSNGKLIIDLNKSGSEVDTIKETQRAGILQMLQNMGITNATEDFISNLSNSKAENNKDGSIKSNVIKRTKELIYYSYTSAYFRSKAELVNNSFIDSEDIIGKGEKKTTVKNYFAKLNELLAKKNTFDNDTAEGHQLQEDNNNEIKDLDYDYGHDLKMLFRDKFFKSIANEMPLYKDLIEWSGKKKYNRNASVKEFYFLNLPVATDFTDHIKELSKRLSVFDESTTSGVIKTPGDSWRMSQSRNTSLDRMYTNGDTEDSGASRIMQKKITKEFSKNEPTVPALKDNLIMKGVIAFDSVITNAGANNSSSSANFGNMTASDIITTIMKDFINNKDSNNPLMLIPIGGNFADKTRGPIARIYSRPGSDMESIFDMGNNESGVSTLKVKDSIMYTHYRNMYDYYTQTRNNAINKFANVIGKEKVTEEDLQKHIDENSNTLEKAEAFAKMIQESSLQKNRDYKIKDGKVVLGDAITLPSDRTIYDKEFLKQFEKTKDKKNSNHPQKIIDYMSLKRRQSLIDFAEQLIKDKFLLDEKAMPFWDKFNAEEHYKTQDEVTGESKLKSKPERIKEYKKSEERKNAIMYEDKDGIKHVNQFISALHDAIHITNKAFLHLTGFDEFNFKNTSDQIKRLAGMVSPTDSFDAEARYGLGSELKVATLEDIGGTHPYMGEKEYDPELYTNGINIIMPWTVHKMFNSSGGELGNNSLTGPQKNQIFGYDRANDKVNYIKSAMLPTTEHLYKHSKYINQLVEKSLQNLSYYNDLGNEVKLIDVYKDYLRKNSWKDANKKFNEFLHDNNLNDQVTDLIVHPSSFKTGLRNINFFDSKPNFANEDLVLPNVLNHFSVPTEHLGSQILKTNDSQNKDKFMTQQNIRGMGYLSHDPSVSASIEHALQGIANIKNEKLKSMFYGRDNKELSLKEKKQKVLDYLYEVAKDDMENPENSPKMRDLLRGLTSDKNVNPEILKDKLIINIVNDIKSYIRAELNGSNRVQAPDYVKYHKREDGMLEPSIEGKEVLHASMPHIYTPSGKENVPGTLEPLTKESFEEWKTNKGNRQIVIKPADVTMEFHQKKEFGIKDEQLHEIMNPENVGINFYDDWHTVRSIGEFETLLDNKLQQEMNKKLNLPKSEFDAQLKGKAIYDLFPRNLQREFDKRGFDISNNSKENLRKIAEYYHDLNQALYMTMDRVPHTGFNSLSIGRYVSFSKDTGNTMYISPEKNVLDGSDFDIDELHTFSFYNRKEKYRTNVVGKDKKGEMRELISNFDQKIMMAYPEVYKKGEFIDKNIDFIFSPINKKVMTDRAAKMEGSKVYYDSDISTYYKKHDQLMQGKKLVGHFISNINSVGTFLNIINSIKDLNKGNQELVKSILNNIPKDLRLLQPENAKHLLQFEKINESYANLATDNANEDGAIGKLGINEGNTALIQGLLLGMNMMEDAKIENQINGVPEEGEAEAKEYDMFDYVTNFINHPLIKRASEIYMSTNRVFSETFDKDYSNAISSAYNELEDHFKTTVQTIELKDKNGNVLKDKEGNIKTQTLNPEKAEYTAIKKAAKKALVLSESINRIADFDIMKDINPSEFTIDNLIHKWEFNLGTSLESYGVNKSKDEREAILKEIRTNGVNKEAQLEFIKNNYKSNERIVNKEEEIRDFDINKIVSQSPLLISYIDMMYNVKNTLDESFMSRRMPEFDDIVKNSLGTNRLLSKENYEKISTEKNRVIIGHFLDTLGTVGKKDVITKMNSTTSEKRNMSFDLTQPEERERLNDNAADIVRTLKIDYPSNDFVKKLQIKKEDRTIAVIESHNSKYNDPTTTEYYGEQFKKMKPEDQKLVQAMNLCIYGFNTPNGSLNEQLGTDMEKQFSSKSNSIESNVHDKNNVENTKKAFIINAKLMKTEKRADVPSKEGEKENRAVAVEGKIFTTTNSKWFENNMEYVKVQTKDEQGKTIEKLMSVAISKVTNNKTIGHGSNVAKDVVALPTIRGINFTTKNILERECKVTFSESKYFKVYDTASDLFTSRIYNGMEAMTENNYRVKVEKNGTFITLTDLDRKSSDNTVKNVPTEVSKRVANDAVDHVISKMEKILPNINIEKVDNETAHVKDATAYFKDGKLYINEDKLTADTPIHEMAHIVTEVLEQTDRTTFNKLFSEAEQMINDNPFLKSFLEDKYQGLSHKESVKEAISLMLGWKSESDVFGSLLKTGDANAKENSKNLWERTKSYIKEIYNNFVNYFGRLFLGPNLRGLQYDEGMTLSDLGDKLYKAWETDKAITNVSTDDLIKIIELNRGKDNLIRNEYRDTKDTTNLFYGEMNNDKRYTDIKKDEIVNELYNEAMNSQNKKEGTLFLNGIHYDLSKFDTEAKRKEYIKNNLVPKINLEQEIWVGNMLDWLNKGANLKTLDTVLGKIDDTAMSEYKKFLRSINYNPKNKYVKYSDIKNVKGFEKIHSSIIEGFNPIVCIEKESGKQKVISIYDMTSMPIYGNGAYNSATVHGNILRKMLSDVKASMKGISLTNKISDVRSLYLQLLMNHINGTSGNVAVREIGLHNLTSYKHYVVDIDSARINKNIEALRGVKEFYEALSPEMKEVYNRKPTNASVDMIEYMKNYYNNLVITSDEKSLMMHATSYLKITNQLELRDQINFRINQLTNIKGMLSQKEITELKLLEESYRYMYGLRSSLSQLNSREVADVISLYVTPTMNIGDEAFQSFRNYITQGSNEVVERLNENFKERLYGTKDNPGIIRSLQKLLPSHQMIGDREFKTYDKMYGTIKDKNGKDVKVRVLLFSADAKDYKGFDEHHAQQFAEQAAMLSPEVLEQAEKLTHYVEDLYLRRIKHEAYMKTSQRITDDEARNNLNSYSTYKKGFVPTMKTRGNEALLKRGSIVSSVGKSLEEFVNDFTSFSDISERSKNQYGLADKIGDSFLDQISYKYTGSKEIDPILQANPDLGEPEQVRKGLGLDVSIDAKTGKYIYESVGDTNDDISTDLHSSMLYFSLATARKEIYEEKVIPHLNAMLAIMKELSYSNNVKEYKDTGTLYKMMLAFADKSMHGIGTIRGDSKISNVEKIYTVANRTLTPLVLFGNAAIPTVHLMYKTMKIATMSLGNLLYDTGIAGPQHFAEGSAAFFGDIDRALAWAYRYQLIRSTEKEAITSRLQTIGKNNDPINWYGNLGNEALEIYTRAVTMIAQMKHDGSWEAHKYDKETGKEYYDEKADKRWQGEEGKALKDYYTNQLSLEEGMDGLSMKRGYFWKAIKATEVINSRILSAAYTGIESPMMESFFIGKVLGKFHRWMYSEYSYIMQKGVEVDEGGRVVIKKNADGSIWKDENGKPVAEWEKMYIEGWGRTTVNLIKDVAVMRDPKAWTKLNKYQKANICKAGSVLAANMALLVVYKYLMSDDSKKHMHKDKTFTTMFEKEAFKSIEGMLLYPDLGKLVASPFSIPNIVDRMVSTWTQNSDITMATLGRNVALINDYNEIFSTPEESKKEVLIKKSKKQ